ncbi:MAG TPA: thiamine pyrophosphate-dependent enzyme [Acidobacteriaceae bacterium]|nr:thiamine pyrophosphate-dependent enzyme [Acidobacteriaceae bacterium]
MSPKKASYENPLIPNARLKQMYRAILRAHLLGEALPPWQRALTAGREAALVSTSLDLAARDIVLDALESPVVDFLRGVPLHRALGSKSGQSRRIVADSGSGRRLPAPADAAGRFWSGVGAAAQIQSTSLPAQSKTGAHDPSVVVVYTLPGEVPGDAWKSALSFAGERDLPIIFVVLPVASAHRRLPKLDIRAIAHRARVPAMPVDAADPVALYRVAQESIGHARIGGGPALIECVSFPTRSSGRPVLGKPALAHLEEYIHSRGIATRAWFEGEGRTFSAQIRNPKPAS